MGRNLPRNGFGLRSMADEPDGSAYALPPADASVKATLSSLWKFTSHLAVGATDSGACGFQWTAVWSETEHAGTILPL
eukprot:3504880-Amphidinium_carterae.1